MFSLVSLSKLNFFLSCRTRVVRVALALHLCRLCRTPVARVWHSFCEID